MRKLLISLFRLNLKLLAKIDSKNITEKVEEESLLPSGAFMQSNIDAPLVRYTDELFDPESNGTIRIQYSCACGDIVYRLNHPDYGFGCVHCDSICTNDLCDNCFDLMSVDYGAPNA